MLTKGKFLSDVEPFLVKMSKDPFSANDEKTISNFSIFVDGLFTGEHIKFPRRKVVGGQVKGVISLRRNVWKNVGFCLFEKHRAGRPR